MPARFSAARHAVFESTPIFLMLAVVVPTEATSLKIWYKQWLYKSVSFLS